MKIFGDSVEEIVGGFSNKISIRINKNSCILVEEDHDDKEDDEEEEIIACIW